MHDVFPILSFFKSVERLPVYLMYASHAYYRTIFHLARTAAVTGAVQGEHGRQRQRGSCCGRGPNIVNACAGIGRHGNSSRNIRVSGGVASSTPGARELA